MNFRRFAPLAFFVSIGLISCGGGSEPEPVETPSAGISSATPEARPMLDSKPAGDDDPVVAEWDGGTIYLSQLDQLAGPWSSGEMGNVQDPGTLERMRYAERRRILDTLVGNYLLLMEARKRGLTLTEAEMADLPRKIKANFRTAEEYQAYLEKANQTEEDLIEVLYNIELGKKCVEVKRQEIQSSLNGEKMRGYYDSHLAMFTPSHRTHLNRVVIHAGDKRTAEEARALAERLRAEAAAEIESATDLEGKRNVMRRMARARSDGWDGQYNGGYLTLYLDIPSSKDAYSPEFIETARKLEPGVLSPVVPTKEGYGFFLVKEQFPSYTHPFDSEAIQNMLPNMILKEEMEAWRESLKDEYGLKLYYERLGETPDSAAGTGTPPPAGPAGQALSE